MRALVVFLRKARSVSLEEWWTSPSYHGGEGRRGRTTDTMSTNAASAKSYKSDVAALQSSVDYKIHHGIHSIVLFMSFRSALRKLETGHCT